MGNIGRARVLMRISYDHCHGGEPFCRGVSGSGGGNAVYQVGELFQSYAVNRSEKNITELMDIRPDFANSAQGRRGRAGGPG